MKRTSWDYMVIGVRARLTAEGRDPEDFHNLGIARDLSRGESWADATLLNRWLSEVYR